MKSTTLWEAVKCNRWLHTTFGQQVQKARHLPAIRVELAQRLKDPSSDASFAYQVLDKAVPMETMDGRRENNGRVKHEKWVTIGRGPTKARQKVAYWSRDEAPDTKERAEAILFLNTGLHPRACKTPLVVKSTAHLQECFELMLSVPPIGGDAQKIPYQFGIDFEAVQIKREWLQEDIDVQLDGVHNPAFLAQNMPTGEYSLPYRRYQGTGHLVLEGLLGPNWAPFPPTDDEETEFTYANVKPQIKAEWGNVPRMQWSRSVTRAVTFAAPGLPPIVCDIKYLFKESTHFRPERHYQKRRKDASGKKHPLVPVTAEDIASLDPDEWEVIVDVEDTASEPEDFVIRMLNGTAVSDHHGRGIIWYATNARGDMTHLNHVMLMCGYRGDPAVHPTAKEDEWCNEIRHPTKVQSKQLRGFDYWPGRGRKDGLGRYMCIMDTNEIVDRFNLKEHFTPVNDEGRPGQAPDQISTTNLALLCTNSRFLANEENKWLFNIQIGPTKRDGPHGSEAKLLKGHSCNPDQLAWFVDGAPEREPSREECDNGCGEFDVTTSVLDKFLDSAIDTGSTKQLRYIAGDAVTSLAVVQFIFLIRRPQDHGFFQTRMGKTIAQCQDALLHICLIPMAFNPIRSFDERTRSHTAVESGINDARVQQRFREMMPRIQTLTRTLASLAMNKWSADGRHRSQLPAFFTEVYSEIFDWADSCVMDTTIRSTIILVRLVFQLAERTFSFTVARAWTNYLTGQVRKGHGLLPPIYINPEASPFKVYPGKKIDQPVMPWMLHPIGHKKTRAEQCLDWYYDQEPRYKKQPRFHFAGFKGEPEYRSKSADWKDAHPGRSDVRRQKGRRDDTAMDTSAPPSLAGGCEYLPVDEETNEQLWNSVITGLSQGAHSSVAPDYQGKPINERFDALLAYSDDAGRNATTGMMKALEVLQTILQKKKLTVLQWNDLMTYFVFTFGNGIASCPDTAENLIFAPIRKIRPEAIGSIEELCERMNRNVHRPYWFDIRRFWLSKIGAPSRRVQGMLMGQPGQFLLTEAECAQMKFAGNAQEAKLSSSYQTRTMARRQHELRGGDPPPIDYDIIGQTGPFRAPAQTDIFTELPDFTALTPVAAKVIERLKTCDLPSEDVVAEL